MGIYCAEAKAQIFRLGYDIQWDLFVICTLFFFFFISIEDLFNIDEFQIEGLISDNRRLNEEIARLEKEKENEPVSKLCLCFFYMVELNFLLLIIIVIIKWRYWWYVTTNEKNIFSAL